MNNLNENEGLSTLLNCVPLKKNKAKMSQFKFKLVVTRCCGFECEQFDELLNKDFVLDQKGNTIAEKKGAFLFSITCKVSAKRKIFQPYMNRDPYFNCIRNHHDLHQSIYE